LTAITSLDGGTSIHSPSGLSAWRPETPCPHVDLFPDVEVGVDEAPVDTVVDELEEPHLVADRTQPISERRPIG